MGTTAVLLLESLRSPRIEHLRSITTSHEKWQKIQNYVENFVFFVVQGFKDSFFMVHFTYVSYIVIAGLWKIYHVSSNDTKWEYEWTSTRRLVKNPVTWRRRSTGRPVTTWITMRKCVTGKEFTLTSWKTEIAKCRRARITWTLCNRRTGEAIPRATNFGSLKIRDETKLLKADME